MHPIVRKLSIFASFTPEEESALILACVRSRIIRSREDFAREDDPPRTVRFLLSGLGCRHKMLEDGRRQIVSFMLPGDACDLGVSLLETRDHSLMAISECDVASSSDASLQHVMGQYPKIRAAFQWQTLVEESIAREWIVNVGQREAVVGAAHLFCEIYFRLQALGMAEGLNYPFPVTQQELGDALGISAVHANRTVQELRQRNLIAFGDKRLTILDLDGLVEMGGFDPAYLHLEARYDTSAA
jgi:CRP-like cAMP-binding protein